MSQEVSLKRKLAIRLGAVILLGVAAPGALAQSVSDVPDRFRLEIGGFRVGSDTNLKLNNGGDSAEEVQFEQDLAVPKTSTRIYLEGFWRLGRRHQVSLGWFRNSRDGEERTLSQDIIWGDNTFTTGGTVHGTAASTYLSGVYRFAAYKNDRFEIGPALGIGHLSVEAGIEGTVSISTPVGSVSHDIGRTVSYGQITGDLGGYLYWWPAKRLLFRGDARYIIVKPENAEASITDGRASLIYHPWPKLGAGVQYAYTKFRYDRGLATRELGGSLRYSGVQLLASFAF